MRRGVAPLVIACCLVSCASAPRGRVASALDQGDIEGALDAYEEFRRSEGGDVDLLAAVAALILEREAEGDDEERRGAALSQLTLAGTAGAPVLIRLPKHPEFEARIDAQQLAARQRDGAPRRARSRTVAIRRPGGGYARHGSTPRPRACSARGGRDTAPAAPPRARSVAAERAQASLGWLASPK